MESQVQSIWFEAQTGLVRPIPTESNFKQYRLPVSAQAMVNDAVDKATLTAGGFDYEPGFLTLLAKLERNHLRDVSRSAFDRKW